VTKVYITNRLLDVLSTNMTLLTSEFYFANYLPNYYNEPPMYSDVTCSKYSVLFFQLLRSRQKKKSFEFQSPWTQIYNVFASSGLLHCADLVTAKPIHQQLGHYKYPLSPVTRLLAPNERMPFFCALYFISKTIWRFLMKLGWKVYHTVLKNYRFGSFRSIWISIMNESKWRDLLKSTEVWKTKNIFQHKIYGTKYMTSVHCLRCFNSFLFCCLRQISIGLLIKL
jgi:hypothetical protein